MKYQQLSVVLADQTSWKLVPPNNTTSVEW